MITLGIDTSNYATSIAVIDNAKHKILLHKKQFLTVDQGKLGLRQQDALFQHVKNLSFLFEELNQFPTLKDVQAVGVSASPTSQENSYMPCFLAGKLSAKSIGAALNKPVIQTSHQMGHIYSALYFLNQNELYHQPVLMLHVSGGTTDVLLIQNGVVVQTLASSNDLFAGQAVDRLGVRLGFGFPAGEYISNLAEECPEEFYPKVSVKEGRCNLSGLENQCDKLLKESALPSYVAKYCLSYIAVSLIKMIEYVQNKHKGLPIVLAGGVMSSTTIKKIILQKMPQALFVEPMFSQDNAIGVASFAYRRINHG